MISSFFDATLLGFGVLGRYQQNDSNLDLWNAICRGLGVTSDRGGDTAGLAHHDADRLDQGHARPDMAQHPV